MWKFVLTAGFGGALMYFLDPDRGRRRRNIARDRTAATVRRASWLAGRKTRYAASTAQGLAEKAVYSRDGDEPLPDEITLAHKVESEIFRDPRVPKGKININVEHGAVVL